MESWLVAGSQVQELGKLPVLHRAALPLKEQIHIPGYALRSITVIGGTSGPHGEKHILLALAGKATVAFPGQGIVWPD